MQKTLPGHSWFLIVCSWEPDADDKAVPTFKEVYDNYLNILTHDDWRDKLKDDDPRLDLDSDSFKALNLIGRRQFVIIGQATSNRVQQELALKIGLGTRIKVEVFPATYVHDLRTVLPSTLPKT